MRSNGLSSFSQRAFEEDVLRSRLFARQSLLMHDPDGIRHVLVDNHENYGRTPATLRVLSPVLGEGLFTSAGQAWWHQRRTLAPAFTPKAVDLLVPHILSATREAIVDLRVAADRGPVDLLTTLQRLALEIAGRTMFSLEMGRHGPMLRAFVARYGRRLGRPHLFDLMLPRGWPAPHDLARALFRRDWVRFIDDIMAERRARSKDGDTRDLFDLLMAARDPETGEGFSARQLRDQVATMILAGHETTAVAMFWAAYLLALAPGVQEQVADEVEGAGDDASNVERPTLTRAVLDEAVRLYPPAYVIVRAAREADVVAGRAVSPGDVVVIAPYVLHRHRRRWRDPDAFDPSRFMPGAPEIPRYTYLPFGVGPRVCIGAHFALREATVVLAQLVRAFRLELIGTRPLLPVAVITTQPDHAPAFRLRAR
jgi:unspecific monooxygenase